MAGHGRHGKARRGTARQGKAGKARRGPARPGKARQAWRGMAWQGAARQGRRGKQNKNPGATIGRGFFIGADMSRAFKAQVDAWTRKSDARLNAVFKESAQRVISEAQTVRGAGGLMRFHTGFLRASGQASLTGWPLGPSRPEDGMGQFDYSIIIAGAKLGQTIYFGWTASYAGFREYEDGFMRSAAQNWESIVSRTTREAMVRFP